MSVKVMAWVWEHSQSKGMDRLVLLAIADCASDDGSNAYPSMAKLVTKTGMTDRGIQKCMARLVGFGELAVSRNGGPRGCNRYRVRMSTPEPRSPRTTFTPEQDSPPNRVRDTPNDVHPEPSSPPNDVPKTPEPRSPGTVLEPSVKNSSSKSSRGTRLSDDFTVTAEMVEWARIDCPDVDGRRETERFHDYWRAISGAKGVKADWPATWRNWMRRAQDNAPRPPSNGVAVRGGAKPSTTDQRVNAALALAARYAAEEAS